MQAAVIILFESDELQTLCSQEKVANKKLGMPGAKKLRARLADVMAAKNMAEIKIGRPHELLGDWNGCIALYLDGGRRLVLRAATDPVPRKKDGGISWSEVDAVSVAFVGDYHD